VLSIGIFFSLMILGLASTLPGTLDHGLVAQGVPKADAARISHLPPVGLLFASFLGYNPMQQLLGPTLPHLSHAHATYLTGRTFFPQLMSKPFSDGLHEAFDFAIAACLVAAAASLLRGGRPADSGDARPANADDQRTLDAAEEQPAAAAGPRPRRVLC